MIGGLILQARAVNIVLMVVRVHVLVRKGKEEVEGEGREGSGE